MNEHLIIVARAEHESRLARAALRQLEYETGHALDETGAYWLARIAALERLHAAARQVAFDHHLPDLLAACDACDVPAPACRPGDHQQVAGSDRAMPGPTVADLDAAC